MKRKRKKGRDKLYSIYEWCALADIGVSTMYRWLRSSKVSVIKVTDFSGPRPATLYYDSDLTAVMYEHL